MDLRAGDPLIAGPICLDRMLPHVSKRFRSLRRGAPKQAV